MRALFLDPPAGERPKVTRVSRHEHAALAGGVVQLFPVGSADHSRLVGAPRVEAPVPKDASDGRREILVEIEPHAAPVSASALSAISWSISSGHAR